MSPVRQTSELLQYAEVGPTLAVLLPVYKTASGARLPPTSQILATYNLLSCFRKVFVLFLLLRKVVAVLPTCTSRRNLLRSLYFPDASSQQKSYFAVAVAVAVAVAWPPRFASKYTMSSHCRCPPTVECPLANITATTGKTPTKKTRKMWKNSSKVWAASRRDTTANLSAPDPEFLYDVYRLLQYFTGNALHKIYSSSLTMSLAQMPDILAVRHSHTKAMQLIRKAETELNDPDRFGHNVHAVVAARRHKTYCRAARFADLIREPESPDRFALACEEVDRLRAAADAVARDEAQKEGNRNRNAQARDQALLAIGPTPGSNTSATGTKRKAAALDGAGQSPSVVVAGRSAVAGPSSVACPSVVAATPTAVDDATPTLRRSKRVKSSPLADGQAEAGTSTSRAAGIAQFTGMTVYDFAPRKTTRAASRPNTTVARTSFYYNLNATNQAENVLHSSIEGYGTQAGPSAPRPTYNYTPIQNQRIGNNVRGYGQQPDTPRMMPAGPMTLSRPYSQPSAYSTNSDWSSGYADPVNQAYMQEVAFGQRFDRNLMQQEDISVRDLAYSAPHLRATLPPTTGQLRIPGKKTPVAVPSVEGGSPMFPGLVKQRTLLPASQPPLPAHMQLEAGPSSGPKKRTPLPTSRPPLRAQSVSGASSPKRPALMAKAVSGGTFMTSIPGTISERTGRVLVGRKIACTNCRTRKYKCQQDGSPDGCVECRNRGEPCQLAAVAATLAAASTAVKQEEGVSAAGEQEDAVMEETGVQQGSEGAVNQENTAIDEVSENVVGQEGTVMQENAVEQDTAIEREDVIMH
ncbi:hypothetical protein B0H66DRAFT_632588 [Apodospora peruviana]|uniref:Zn(2)-C6 fungal-type domain-containing protein n=1 Tax=Apodospora peruviana TaxID=516989 RepID=A0AAE0HSN4_9PEZI|nr:hypothetical protein B0H66DRAFT_632588 [Apodospora peruviana]